MAAHALSCPNLSSQRVKAVAALAEVEKAAEMRKAERRPRVSTNTENIPPAGSTLLRVAPISRSGSTSSHFDSDLESPPAKRAKKTLLEPIWDAACQEDFAADLCKLFIACGMAWNVAENPQFQLFFEKWLPKADIPDRHSLSGKHLNKVSGEATGMVRKSVHNKLAMGQCDGWKNVAKTNVVSTVMSVSHKVSIFRSSSHIRDLMVWVAISHPNT